VVYHHKLRGLGEIEEVEKKHPPYAGELNTTQFITSKDEQNSIISVTSFADRPNTGKQPVADWVPINCEFESDEFAYDMQADYFEWSLEDPNAIKSWKPNFDALHELYEKETATPEKQCGPDVHPSNKKPACYAQADDKPVFKIEMKIGGGKNVDEIYEPGKFVYQGSKYSIFATEDGREYSRRNSKIKTRAIDTRSDYVKAAAGIAKAIRNANISGQTYDGAVCDAIKANKIHGVKWVGE